MKINRMILYLAFALVVFYPIKGVFSLVVCLILGADISDVFLNSLTAITFGFLFLSVLVNKITVPRNFDKIIFFIGCFAFIMACLHIDQRMVTNTILLFFFPVILYKFVKVDDKMFFRVITIFFVVSIVFLLIENIFLYPARYGLPFESPSKDQYLNFANMLVSRSGANIYQGELAYFASRGLPVRTGGYLGNNLAMSALISMMTTFFYILFREKKRVLLVIPLIASMYLMINAITTTGIVAFVVCLLYYEGFIKRSPKSIFVFAIVFLSLVLFFLTSKMGLFISNRILTNFNDPSYVSAFFNFSHLIVPQNVIYLLIGKWRWEGSEVEYISLLLTYGWFPCWLLARRFLLPLRNIHSSDRLDLKIYALLTLNGFVCFFHQQMALNLNVIFLLIILMLKANDLVKREQKIVYS